MKITITSGAAALALAAFSTGCASVSGPTAPSGRTYLVGVAGGG